jgi:hypothetical protein
MMCGATQQARAQIVTNGSFENTTNFVDNEGSDDTMQLFPGSMVMTGWTVVTDQIAWIGPTNPFDLTAEDGSYFLDLTGYQDGAPYGGITQNISTTLGATYSLTFFLGADSAYGVPDGLTASATGTPGQSYSWGGPVTGGGWLGESYSFVASGLTTTITLQGSSGSNYIGLDNVAVTQTAGAAPEPGSLLLCVAAVVAGPMAMVRRRWGTAARRAV